MQSPAEHILVRSFRSILADLPTGFEIEESAEFRSALNALEFFVSEVLSEIHSEWRGEALDGVIPLTSRKTGEREVEILGLCILLSDQTVTPIQLRLQIAPASDEVSWFECRLGERGREGMVRTPYERRSKRLYALEGRTDSIDWVYQVTFGDRRDS
jgi:hypothetical protein